MSISRFFVKKTPGVIDLVDSDELSDEGEQEKTGCALPRDNGSSLPVTTNDHTESTQSFSESAEHSEQAGISAQLKEESGLQTTSVSLQDKAIKDPPESMSSRTPYLDAAESFRERNEEVSASATNTLSVSLMTDDTAAGSSNPFAKFAFQKKEGSSPGKQSSLDSWFTKPPAPKKPRTFSAGGKEWIRMQDLPVDEQERIITKWHSFLADPCSLEDSRFQILVAARLHARCQEGPVRQAMKALNELCRNGISVQQFAQMNPQDLHPAIANLQYYPTKAKHLVKAAQEIQSQFAAKVPEHESQLRQLTGIGPVLADLLAFVNTRKVHQDRAASQTKPRA